MAFSTVSKEYISSILPESAILEYTKTCGSNFIFISLEPGEVEILAHLVAQGRIPSEIFGSSGGRTTNKVSWAMLMPVPIGCKVIQELATRGVRCIENPSFCEVRPIRGDVVTRIHQSLI